jgi:hypothetical protein
MKISTEAKETAYNDAINYLLSENTSYDDLGDYKEGRQWLANKLRKEVLHKFKAIKENKVPDYMCTCRQSGNMRDFNCPVHKGG